MITLDLACRYVAAGLPVEGDWPESSRVPEVAAMFGLSADEDRALTVLPATRLQLRPHTIVFVTGPSGSGKSTLLRLMEERLARHRRARAVRLDSPPLPDAAMVDCLAAPLDETLRLLSIAGLADAFVLLRRPAQASDGQRYRLRLAAALHRASDGCGGRLLVILADEFGATLDRVTACNIARNLRRWVSRTPVCLVAATSHDDLLEALEPDVLVEKGLGDQVEVVSRRT